MSNDLKFENIGTGWDTALVMVCSKCGQQFNDPIEKEFPEKIKAELKTRSKSELGRAVRVITTSCLNICPVNKIAVVVASQNIPEVFQGISVDLKYPNIPEAKLFDDLYKEVKNRLAISSNPSSANN